MGRLDHGAVSQPMASADVFVFPSCTDTAGNVVLEAQACGLPVLVSDRGGPRENMRPGVTGHVCRGGRGRNLADAIAALATEPERRRAMASAARRYALTRRWDRALAPLYEAYRRAAARRPAGAAAATWPARLRRGRTTGPP